MKTWILFALGVALILSGAVLASLVQTSGGIVIHDVRFAGANGLEMSALLYVPANATAQTPAPGVLAVHGYINTRETQSGFAIEFARRGYVVLALDQTGHGMSDPPAFANGFGGPDGLRYLRGLPFVDGDNIGLEGHSMGGWTVLAAAAAMPNAYRAMVLEGSSTGSKFAPEGSAQFPRNLAVVFSRYDEFSQLMWEVARAADAPSSAKLRAIFATPDAIVPGRLYGSIERGDARILYTPVTTHPGDHISTEAIGASLGWFQRTLRGGTPRAPGDQIWWGKEAGTFVSLIGFVALLLGMTGLLLQVPYLRLAAAQVEPVRKVRDWRWWMLLALSAAVPAATFFPLLHAGEALVPPSALLPEGMTNQFALWAVANAVIALIAGRVLGAKVANTHRLVPSIAIALGVFAVGYGALLLVDALFKTDFRLWVVAFRPMSAAQWRAFAVYLVPFVFFFLVAGRGLSALAVKGASSVAVYATALAAMSMGFALLLALEYGALFASGELLTPAEPLNTVVAIQFLPLTALAALIATFTYRRTDSYVPGALICALVVTWYIVAGQAMHVG